MHKVLYYKFKKIKIFAPSNMEPMKRPSYNEGYIHVGTDGYNYHTHRSGGYAVKSTGRHPCQCCGGFGTAIKCQYGNQCYQRTFIPKSDFC